MSRYYKYYENYRFQHIANKKLELHNKNAMKQFYYFFSFAISLVFLFPSLQLIFWWTHPITVYYYEYWEFWKNRILVFFVIGIVSLALSFIGSKGLSKYRVHDQFKKLKLFTPNLSRILVFFILALFINFTIYYFFDSISDINFVYDEPDQKLRLILSFVSVGMYTSFIFWIMGLFVYCFFTIKKEINEVKKDNSNVDKFPYIYWIYFVKNLVLNKPLMLMGSVLFVGLTCISFVIRGGEADFFRKHFIFSVAFYSFWVTSANLANEPVFSGIRNLSYVYNQYSLHIIRNSILPKLRDHIVVIGARNLGKQIIRNCFAFIHPEGYGAETLYEDTDYKVNKTDDRVSDYDVIIDKNLDILIISRRIVVIDKDSELFRERYKDIGDISIVIYEPWVEGVHLGLVGICGDAFNEYAVNALAIQRADVVVNATPTPNLSLHLHSKYPTLKLLTSVNDSYTFDTLLSTTYDKSVFLIDTQSTEGINLALSIFHWTYKNINNNLLDFQKANLDNFDELRKKINLEYYQRQIQEVTDKEKPSLDGLMKFCSVLKGNGRILLVGSGSYTYHIIKSLMLLMKFEMNITDEMIKTVIENKIFLLSDDEKINSECVDDIKLGTNSTVWRFYPVRNKFTTVESAINIRLFKKAYGNFERFVEVLTAKTADNINLKQNANKTGQCISHDCQNDKHLLLPELIVIVNATAYTSIDMFISVSTAAEVVNQSLSNNALSSGKNLYRPHIMVYSNRSDKSFLIEQFKKYYCFNIERKEKIGYPTQLEKESRLTKDWLGALQYSSMLQALSINRASDSEEVSEDAPVAEITFSLVDKPGSLASVAAAIIGKKLKDIAIDHDTKVPFFINYFSAEEIRYKDTFLFKGLAKLQPLKVNGVEPPISYSFDFANSVNYCFINFKEGNREQISELLENNLNYRNTGSENDFKTTKERTYDSGMFSHYPISTILRHSNRHNDILNVRPRLLLYDRRSRKDEREENGANTIEELMLKLNIADFSLWAEGETEAGSLAEVLSQILYSRTEKNDDVTPSESYEPFILFSNDRPTTKIDKDDIAQDSFYIKLRKRDKESQLEYKIRNGLIRAIKLKLSCKILLKNLDWSKYLFRLKKHLSEIVIHGYNLFIIRKKYIEGLRIAGRENYTSISVYNEIDENDKEMEIENGGKFEFSVLRQLKLTGDKWRELPVLSVDKNQADELTSNEDTFEGIYEDAYEFALIRTDIVQLALAEKTEIERKIENNHLTEDDYFGKYQNMLFFVDDQ